MYEKVFALIQKLIIRGLEHVDTLIKYDEIPLFQEWLMSLNIMNSLVSIMINTK